MTFAPMTSIKLAGPGDPGDRVYVLLHTGEWKADEIVLEDVVATANLRRSGLEDLDWYHQAVDLDTERKRRNRRRRWQMVCAWRWNSAAPTAGRRVRYLALK